MRHLRLWLMAIVVAVGFAGVSAVYTTLSMACRQHSSASLTAGLAGTWERINDDFQARVKSRFPVSSDENEMTDELRREGFTWQDWESLPDGEHKATRNGSDCVCNKGPVIYWHSNAQGRLTAIRGEYPTGVCL